MYILPRLQVQPLTRISIPFADVLADGIAPRIYFPPETTGIDEQSVEQPVHHHEPFFSIVDASNDIVFSLPLNTRTFMRLCAAFNRSATSSGWVSSSCSDIEIECAAPAIQVSADVSSAASITPPGPPSILQRFGGFDTSYIVSPSPPGPQQL
jgi:hypothetical protein